VLLGGELEGGALELTQDGHAVAALIAIDDADAESLAFSMSPRLQTIIEQARDEYRRGHALTPEEVRRALGSS
jgi:hypothetical protein